MATLIEKPESPKKRSEIPSNNDESAVDVSYLEAIGTEIALKRRAQPGILFAVKKNWRLVNFQC